MVTEIEYKDEMGSRSRKAFALIIQGDRVHEFTGVSIPGVVVVKTTTPVKNGKWSHSKYVLALASDTRLISGHSGFNTGTFTEGLAQAIGAKEATTVAELATQLGVSAEETERLLADRWPKTLARLRECEAQMASLR